MADTPFNITDFADPASTDRGYQESVDEARAQNAGIGWSDYGHTIAGATAGLGAGLAGYADRWGLLDQQGQYNKQYLEDLQKEQQEQLSPSAQEAGKGLFETSRPISHLTLGLASMAPSLVAAVVPGTMVVRALGLTGAVGATVGTAVGSAPVSASMAGEVFNNIQNEVKETDDKTLRKNNPFYNGLRSDGMSEDDARAKTVDHITSFKPEVMLAVAEMANRFGPAFQSAAKAAGVAGRGVVRGAVLGMGEQAAAQGALAGTSDVITQLGKQGVHPELEDNWKEALSAAFEGGTLGAITGAVTGAIHGRGAAPAPKKPANVDQDAATAIAALPQNKPAAEAAPAGEPAFATPGAAAPADEAEAPRLPPPAAAAGAPPPSATVPPAAPPPAATAAPPAAAAPPPVPAAAPKPFVRTKDDYADAIQVMRDTGKASTSFMQRRLGMSYNKVANLMDRLEADGVISAGDKNGKRTILKLPDEAKAPPPAPASESPAATPVEAARPQEEIPPPGATAKPAEAPAGTRVIDRADLMSRFADKTGKLTLDKTSDAVSAEVGEALKAGKEVNLHIEGKKVPITSINKIGMLTDNKDQAWGLMPLLSPAPGDHVRIEITEPAKRAKAAEAPPAEAAPAKRGQLALHQDYIDELNRQLEAETDPAGRKALQGKLDTAQAALARMKELQGEREAPAKAEPPKVLEDTEAQKRKREGPRVSAPEAVSDKGLERFASSGDPKADLAAWTGKDSQNDRDAVKNLVRHRVAAAERPGSDYKLSPATEKLKKSAFANMRGRGPAVETNRANYSEHRQDLAREEGEKLEASKGERGTREAQGERAREAALASHEAQAQMAGTIIRDHKPPSLADESGAETPPAMLRLKMRQHIDTVLKAAEDAGVDIPKTRQAAKDDESLIHLMELKRLRESIAEKDWGKLTKEQAANRQMAMNEAIADATLLRAGKEGEVKERRATQSKKSEATYGEELGTGKIEASYQGIVGGEEPALDEEDKPLPTRQKQLEEEAKQKTAAEAHTEKQLDKEKKEEAAREAEREKFRAEQAARKAAAEPAAAESPKAAAAIVVSKRRGRTVVTLPGKPKVDVRAEPKADVQAELAHADSLVAREIAAHPSAPPEDQALERVRVPHTPVQKTGADTRPDIFVRDPKTGLETTERVKPLQTSKLGPLLRSMGVDYDARETLPGLRWLTNTMRERVIRLVGDMDVHVLSEEDFARLYGQQAVGLYSGTYHRVMLSARVLERGRAGAHEALLHEAIHAAFVHTLETTPKLMKEVTKLVNALRVQRKQLEAKGWTVDDLYGLKSEHDFVAEAFANPRFQRLLKSVQFHSTPQLSAAFHHLPGHAKLQNMWDRMRGVVRKALGMSAKHDTMLDRAMDIGHILDYVRQDRMEAGIDITWRQYERERRAAEGLPPDQFKMRTLDPTEPPENEARGALGEMAARVKQAISGTGFSDMARNALNYVTSSDQLRQRNQHMFHGEGLGNVVHDLYYSMMKKGHYADELKKVGEDLNADLIDTREKVGPESFKRFENMVLDASWNGMDPSTPLGAGRNEHLGLSKALLNKVKSKGWGSVANEASRVGWQARGKWAEANKEYLSLTAKHPELAKLMDRAFDYFADAQKEMAQAGVENLLHGNLYRGDVKARATELLAHPGGQEWKDAIAKEPGLGEDFLSELLRQRELNVSKGPYAPFMRRGNWVVHGRYKIEAPANATRLSHNEFEFATRKEAHDFAANHDLHLAESHTRYYNPDDPSLGAEAGKRTTREGLTSAGNPVEREYVRLEDQYVKFHPNEKEAKRDYEMLKASGLMREVYSPEIRKNGVFQASELTRSSLALIDKRLQQNQVYQAAGPGQRQAMRQALQEASLAARAGVRMQHRRLPRRHVLGYSDDFMQTLYEYNNSQGNFRALQKYRPQIDDALMRMRREQEDRRNESGNTERSIAAAQWEKRAAPEDPNADMSKSAAWTRRINMMSYLDRMLRPSHLLLHQTHLPMITAPAMFGRHGMQAYAEVMKAWRGASGAYKTGIMDTWGALQQALPKAVRGGGRKALTFRGTDYDTFMDNRFKGEKDGSQLLQLFRTARKSNLMHITGGVEIGKYGPTVEGPLGYADRALAKMDTIYRHASNAADSMIRHAALVAAFRLERDKLTQQGKFTRAEVMDKATQYAMDVVSNTQGNYAVNNAAPIFQNKVLRPLLQFKQFPQMMYHLLVKNTVDIFKGETPEARWAAGKSLGAVLASHTLMTGFLGGLPMELPRAMLALSKGLGITSGDMQDLEKKEAELLHSMFGQVGGDLMLHGLSRAMGVDAHHRLGLNSFFTFGIDDVHDWNSFAGFMLDQPAPVGLAKDTFQGVTKMLHGDIEGGAAKAFPLQALRDIKKAWTGQGAGGYQYTPIERGFRGLGFTPAGEAASMEATSKAVKDAEEKKDERSRTMGIYFRAATPEQTKAATAAIDEYNKKATGRNKIGIKGLEAIKKSRSKQQEEARSQF